ncbi:SDR family NAD(P)-dependent oxidoreductase [Actinoplanes sp. NPDC000266]
MTDYRARSVRRPTHALGAMGAVVGLLHLAGIVVLSGEPALAGVGIVAYLLGVRHAFDARHVAVIAKFSGRGPLTAGFWFSLGSATTVFSVTFLLAMIVQPTASTTPAGVFLAILGALNLVVLIGALMGRGRKYDGSAASYGLLGRLSRWVRHPWQLFPLGVIVGFGLLITAETGLLLLAATAAVPDLPLAAIITQPLLFAAGLCLVGAVQGVRMSTPTAEPAAGIVFTTTVAVGTLAIAAIDLAAIDVTPGPLPDLAGLPLAAILLLVLAILAFVAIRRYRRRPSRSSSIPSPSRSSASPANQTPPFTQRSAPPSVLPAIPPVGPPLAQSFVPPSAPPVGPPLAQASASPFTSPVAPSSVPPIGLPLAPSSAPPLAPSSASPIAPPVPPAGLPLAPPFTSASAPPFTSASAPPFTSAVAPSSAPPARLPLAQASAPPLAATEAMVLGASSGWGLVPDSDRGTGSAPVSDRAVADGLAVVAARRGTGPDHGRGVARVARSGAGERLASGHAAVRDGYSAAGEGQPTSNGGHLAASAGHSASSGEQPVARDGYPASSGEQPVAGDGYRATSGEQPVARDGYRASSGEQPVAGDGYRATSGEQPVARDWYPATSGEQLAARGGNSAASDQYSAVSDGNPAGSGGRSVASGPTVGDDTAAGPEPSGVVAVVTGAGAGLGRAIALGLAASGYGVVAVDLDAESAEACAVQALAYGVAARAMAADVRDPLFLERIVAAAGELGASGGPSVLVNSVAGWVAERYPQVEAWVPPTLDLTDATLLSQLVLDPMGSRGGGAIVNVIAGGAGTDLEARLVRFTGTFAGVAERFGVRAMCVTADRLIVTAADVLNAVLDLIDRGGPGAIVELRGGQTARSDQDSHAGRTGTGDVGGTGSGRQVGRVASGEVGRISGGGQLGRGGSGQVSQADRSDGSGGSGPQGRPGTVRASAAVV